MFYHSFGRKVTGHAGQTGLAANVTFYEFTPNSTFCCTEIPAAKTKRTEWRFWNTKLANKILLSHGCDESPAKLMRSDSLGNFPRSYIDLWLFVFSTTRIKFEFAPNSVTHAHSGCWLCSAVVFPPFTNRFLVVAFRAKCNSTIPPGFGVFRWKSQQSQRPCFDESDNFVKFCK